MNDILKLVLALVASAVIAGLLTVLYWFEGAGPAGLLTLLGWLMALGGLVSFVSLCGCLFVSESTRQSRMGAMVCGLASFGAFCALNSWLKPVENLECYSIGSRSRSGVDELVCHLVTRLPLSWQSPAWFIVLLCVLLICVWLFKLGWRVYVDER